MDFTLPNEIETLRHRVREFVSRRIIPLEADRANYDAHENIAEPVLMQLRDEVKTAGLWAPQIAKEFGGLGLSYVGLAALYEENGAFHLWRSIFQQRGAGRRQHEAAATKGHSRTAALVVATGGQR